MMVSGGFGLVISQANFHRVLMANRGLVHEYDEETVNSCQPMEVNAML